VEIYILALISTEVVIYSLKTIYALKIVAGINYSFENITAGKACRFIFS